MASKRRYAKKQVVEMLLNTSYNDSESDSDSEEAVKRPRTDNMDLHILRVCYTISISFVHCSSFGLQLGPSR